jgi:hypothetical protein
LPSSPSPQHEAQSQYPAQIQEQSLPTQADDKEKEPAMTIVQEDQPEINFESPIKDNNDELMMEVAEENKEKIVINKEEQVEKDNNIENEEIENEVVKSSDIADTEPTTTSIKNEFNVIFLCKI